MSDQKQNRINEISHTIYQCKEELDKEKGKRLKILFIFYSVLGGIGLYTLISPDSLASWFSVLYLSAVFGCLSLYVPICLLSAVGSLFTKINDLEDNIQHLEMELYHLKAPKDPDDSQ